MRCPRQERIEQLAAGSQDPALLRIRAHVEECERCRRLFEQAKADAKYADDTHDHARGRQEATPHGGDHSTEGD
jgi:hypothetical protein